MSRSVFRFLAILPLFCHHGSAASPPMSAEQAVAAMKLPSGFHATAFASEPDVHQPVAMTFDDRGRMWVAEYNTYAPLPQVIDPTQHDRVLIFDEKDGHGGKPKVFWDKGLRLTSVEVGFGGVWVLCAPHLLFIPDRNHDDIPDGPPEVVLDGWEPTQGRHNIVNGLKWGPDGWLYGRQGNSTTSTVGVPGTPAEKRIRFNAGIWRYHPVTKKFEVVCQGTTNPWGHDWNENGDLFFINTVNGHLWHGIPGARFERQNSVDPDPHAYQLIGQHADHYHWDTGKGWQDSRKVTGLTDQLGGGHAHVGMMIYQGRQWPKEYWGDLFTLNFSGHRVNQDHLEREGSGYVGRHRPDPIHFGDPWFRGMEITTGPDGGVYALDWSDEGECHNTSAINRESGRIYKIMADAPPVAHEADLAALSDEKLLALILDPNANEWAFRHSQRILQERTAGGKDLTAIRETLATLLRKRDESVNYQLHALWALQAIGGANESLLIEELKNPCEYLRAWAIRLHMENTPVAGAFPPRSPFALNQIQTGIPSEAGACRACSYLVPLAEKETSAHVRLALASALHQFPIAERPALAAALLFHGEDASDHNIPLVIWYALEPVCEQAPKAAIQLAVDSKIPLIRRFISRRLAEDITVRPELVDELVKAITASGPDAARREVLLGLRDGSKGLRKAVAPKSWQGFHVTLEDDSDPEVVTALRELAVLFGDGRALEELFKIVEDSKQTASARTAALAQLVESHAEGLLPRLKSWVKTPALASAAAPALAGFDDPEAPKLALGAFPKLTESAQATTVTALCGRPASARVLLNAVTEGKIKRTQVSAFQARQMANLGDAPLLKQLTEVWGEIRVSDTARKEKQTKYQALLTPARLAKADTERGHTLFLQTCSVCHRLSGEGSTLAPDLTGSDRHNLGYLLENILDPSAVIPADFRLTVVETQDGRVLSGIIKSQTERMLTIQSPAETVLVERSSVKKMTTLEQSLMPEGLLDAMKEDQVADLIGYLMK